VLAALLLAAAVPAAEQRALDWLVSHVPAWPRDNRCFSCHHNGDGARALFAARRLGREVPASAVESTTGWLRRPAQWDTLPGEAAFSDKRLARIQFAAALADAVEAGATAERAALLEAARSLIPLQHRDGYWPLEGGDLLPSPATWGHALAAHFASLVLRRADSKQFREPIQRAERWLAALKLSSVPDAAAVVFGLGPAARPDAVDLLIRAQGGSGGWGPYPNSPPEPFDTALALLALRYLDNRGDVGARVERGRAWLVSAQLPDGAWPETTRPAGGQSYAQRASTTAWATLALLVR